MVCLYSDNRPHLGPALSFFCQILPWRLCRGWPFLYLLRLLDDGQSDWRIRPKWVHRFGGLFQKALLSDFSTPGPDDSDCNASGPAGSEWLPGQYRQSDYHHPGLRHQLLWNFIGRLLWKPVHPPPLCPYLDPGCGNSFLYPLDPNRPLHGQSGPKNWPAQRFYLPQFWSDCPS